MLLTLRHEWRLKRTEKYALDRVSGVCWEFCLFAFSSLFTRPIAPGLVQVLEKKWRKLPSDLWADFPTVALPTRARCGLQKNRFFLSGAIGSLRSLPVAIPGPSSLRIVSLRSPRTLGRS
jgi:hypothetical protein